MKRTKLAARYAKALFEFAKERNEVEEISKDILLIDDTFDNNPELRFTFNSPIVHSDKKAAILRDLFESRVSEPSFRYLMLILRKGRELQLDTICSEYVKIYLLDDFIDIVVDDDMIDITDGRDHEQTLGCGINHVSFGFIFQNALVALNGNRQFIAQRTRILK